MGDKITDDEFAKLVWQVLFGFGIIRSVQGNYDVSEYYNEPVKGEFVCVCVVLCFVCTT